MSKSSRGWSGDPNRKLRFNRGGRTLLEEYVEKNGQRGSGQDLRFTLIVCPMCAVAKRPNAFTNRPSGRRGSIRNDSPLCRVCQKRTM